MKTNYIKYWMLSAIFMVAACKPNIDAPTPTSGSADFSKYIAIGNSLTAGYSDGGLYLEVQKTAYPNLIAEQMKQIGGGDFTSPFFTEAQANGSGYLKLTGFTADGRPITGNVTDKLAYRAPDLFTKYTDEIQNLGIPGMRLDLGYAAPTFSAANNYFERLLPDAQVGQTTYFNYMQNRNHTFFSFWLGNNDILGWAANGGVEEDVRSHLTDKAQFAQLYGAYITALTAQGQKGILATIPDVTSVPYFNTVTVAAVNAGLKANPNTANLSLYINALNTSTGLNIARLATEKDLLILTFNTALIGTTVDGKPFYGLSPLNPIASNQVLDEAEVTIAKDYVTNYNASIKAIAEAKGLAVVDTYTILNGIKTPKIYDGVTVSSAYITGNVFSLDGIHLTPMGNAIIANEFIAAINAKYNANLPKVSVGNYRAVKFPAVLTD